MNLFDKFVFAFAAAGLCYFAYTELNREPCKQLPNKVEIPKEAQ